MITRDRLEELIQQKATVYYLYGSDIEQLELFSGHKIYNNGKYDLIFIFGEVGMELKLSDLFENQSEAEWVAKIHDKRTERFEPPIYEDFIKEPFITVDYEDGYKFMTKGGHFAYIRYNEYSDGTANFEVGGNWVGYECFEPATKENYIKACEYARNLFLGKENENV